MSTDAGRPCLLPGCTAESRPGSRLCSACGRPLAGASLGPGEGYRVEGYLGSGHYADVFRVVGQSSGSSLAAKAYLDEPSRRTAAGRETAALRRLSHRRIPRLEAAFEQDGWLFVVMELVEGPSVRDEVERSGPLAVDRAVAMAADVCEALGYVAGQGWTYRDLHPRNVHHRTDRGTMVLDFDGARPPGWPSQVAGRIGYRAPELAEPGEVTAACDVYSLAGCVFFAVTGEDPPTRPGELPGLRERVGRIAAVLEECRREEPGRRPSIGELAGELVGARG